MQFSYTPTVEETVACNLRFFKSETPRGKLFLGPRGIKVCAVMGAVVGVYFFVGSSDVLNSSVTITSFSWGAFWGIVSFFAAFFCFLTLRFLVKITLISRLRQEIGKGFSDHERTIEIESGKIAFIGGGVRKEFSSSSIDKVISGGDWLMLKARDGSFSFAPRICGGVDIFSLVKKEMRLDEGDSR